MSAALSPVPDAAPPAEPHFDAAKALSFIEGLSSRIDKLGELVEVAGTINTAVNAIFVRADAINDVAVAADQMVRANQTISQTAERAQASALEVKEGMTSATTAIRDGLTGARTSVATLASAASVFSSILSEATATVQKVSESSDAINSIAREIQLIAINAGVEAARSGVAGRGFAVIANAIKDLAEQTRAATAENARQLDALGQAVSRLSEQSAQNEAQAKAAHAESDMISSRLAEFDAFGAAVQRLVHDIDEIANPVRDNIRVCDSVTQQLHHVVDGFEEARTDFADAASRIDTLVGTTETLISYIASSTVEAKDGRLVAIARGKAARISALFETAVRRGDITLDDLFDQDYRPIGGTDPQQFTTRFLGLTDRLLPAEQEPVLDLDPRIVFCSAVDRNGYLPTHNKKFSQPQGRDPVWNAAHCRNRRIFDDRTGLAAAQNTKPSLVQTYRRDMGGGVFVNMKDISAPIRVMGRHWGGFRIGVKA